GGGGVEVARGVSGHPGRDGGDDGAAGGHAAHRHGVDGRAAAHRRGLGAARGAADGDAGAGKAAHRLAEHGGEVDRRAVGGIGLAGRLVDRHRRRRGVAHREARRAARGAAGRGDADRAARGPCRHRGRAPGALPVTAVPLLTATAPLTPLTGLLEAAVKLVGQLVAGAPSGPAWGVETVGGGGSTTVKLAALLAVPSEVVTLIGPLVAPAGT